MADPPADQEHEQRLSLVFFNGSKGDMRLRPFTESPLLQREGYVLKQGVFMQFQKLMDAGVPVRNTIKPDLPELTKIVSQVPTNKEWREARE